MEVADLQQMSESDRQEMLEAESRLYSQYFSGTTEDRRPTEIAILAAILFHVFILYVSFPSFNMSSPTVNPEKVIYVRTWRPPPPPKKEPPKPVKEKKLKTKKIPIPDPTPEEPEPIKEPEPEPEPEPLPVDAIALIGVPDLPPTANTGPLIAGSAGVSEPVAIYKPRPEYPEMARKAGIQGKVFLQAVISSDGTVKDASVLSSTSTNAGFEEAALKAVKTWRYKPAEQNGRPVDVLFTIVVNFTIS
ncbi:MAG: energy transducer TonB [Acidobacteriota bacterium]